MCIEEPSDRDNHNLDPGGIRRKGEQYMCIRYSQALNTYPLYRILASFYL